MRSVESAGALIQNQSCPTRSNINQLINHLVAMEATKRKKKQNQQP